MKKNPLGIERFPDLINRGLAYVDKTRYISMFADGGYYYLSRPRYFGKSLFLDSLKVAFEGRKDMFEGMYIENNWDWSRQYLVVKINLGNFYIRNANELEEAISETLGEIESFHRITPPANVALPTRFYHLIKGLYEKSGNKIVILVDDCAKPLHDTYEDINTVLECQKVLKGFYTVLKRSAPYVHLAFFCGIGNFYKNSLFIGLSEMTDISLRAEFSSLCGFTEEEVATLLEHTQSPLEHEAIKDHYYGYSWGAAEKCYNPYDILCALKEQKCKDFWAEAVHSKQIVNHFRNSACYLPTLECLSATENSLLYSDMSNIDFISYLFQTGYLTITHLDEYSPFHRYTLSYPNNSVKTSLIMRVLRELVQSNQAAIENAASLYKALDQVEMDGFKDIFDAFFHQIPADYLEQCLQKDCGCFHIAVFYCFFVVTGFAIRLEELSERNHLCLSVKVNGTVYYFDFSIGPDIPKVRKSLDLVKEQGYAFESYGDDQDTYAIASIFSTEKNSIERLDWEQVKQAENAFEVE